MKTKGRAIDINDDMISPSFLLGIIRNVEVIEIPPEVEVIEIPPEVEVIEIPPEVEPSKPVNIL